MMKEKYLNINEDFINKLNTVKKIYNDNERNINEKKILDLDQIKNNNSCNEKEEVYLISSSWFNKASSFIDEVTNKYSLRTKDDLFDLNKFFSKYLLLEKDSRKINKTYGIYPGPINNFHLLNSKDYWYDPCEINSYLNSELTKTITQKQDFFILEKEEWELVKEIFNCQYEIKRYRSVKTNQIEIFPKEVMIFYLDLIIKIVQIDYSKFRIKEKSH